MRIRGYDEETEQYTGGVEELSGDIADLTKSAEHPLGVSLFKDSAKTEYKSTVGDYIIATIDLSNLETSQLNKS